MRAREQWPFHGYLSPGQFFDVVQARIEFIEDWLHDLDAARNIQVYRRLQGRQDYDLEP